MSTNVVVVESPAKARTIEKYLGPGYTVLASYGHVRDLVPKEGAVDQTYCGHYCLVRRSLAKANQKPLAIYSPVMKGLGGEREG